MVLAEQGDKFLKLRQRREAAAAFERALEAAENTAPPLEVAHLCQKLAGLQAAFSSAAEARGTLQRGIAVLKRSKGGNAPEQMRLIDEMESRLRSMPRD